MKGLTFVILLISLHITAQINPNINQFDKQGKKHGKWKGYNENKQSKRYEGELLYHRRYINIFRGLQKELKRRDIDSLLWHWWGPELNEVTPDKENKNYLLGRKDINFIYETLVG